MAEITSLGISVPNSDIRRIVTGNHNKIMGLFLIYLRSPADSRAALAKEILHQLAGHLAIVEERLFPEIRALGTQGQTLVGNAERQHEELKAMILPGTWEQAEGDDDQEWDQFFEETPRRTGPSAVRDRRA